ncbi:hypothetical protein GC173_07190 [bacterium]|nr:hypothetical protein [bacterium]
MNTSLQANLTREEAFMVIMQRLHGRWRMAILLPMIYLLLGAVVIKSWFIPSQGPAGLLPLSNELFSLLALMGGLLIGALWLLLGRSQAAQYEALRLHHDDPEAFLREAKRHQLVQFALCDLAASIGILLFVVQGDFTVLLAFCLASEVLYLKAFPSDLRLGEAMFRSSGV